METSRQAVIQKQIQQWARKYKLSGSVIVYVSEGGEVLWLDFSQVEYPSASDRLAFPLEMILLRSLEESLPHWDATWYRPEQYLQPEESFTVALAATPQGRQPIVRSVSYSNVVPVYS